MLPAMRFLLRPKSIKMSSASSGCPYSSRCKSGVLVLRASVTCANAEITKETGEITFLVSLPSRHSVAMDKESLPTGMDMPSAGHSSIPTALTESKSLASSPGLPQAAIQLADNFTVSRPLMSAANILVMASPTAMRAAAGASMTAIGVRSPIDIASPR